MKVRRELEKVGRREDQRVDGEVIHQGEHLVVAVTPHGLRQLWHVGLVLEMVAGRWPPSGMEL
jgi:hypothetical protein